MRYETQEHHSSYASQASPVTTHFLSIYYANGTKTLGGNSTRIVRIPHTATEVREHMSSVNAIMFSRDNQTHLVLPVYPHQVRADTPDEPLDPNTLVGTARTAYDTFSSLGIVVTPVRDPGESDSGLHCKTNQFTR